MRHVPVWPSAKHELIRDDAEAVQAVQSFTHQVDLVITDHLADRYLAVRVGVEGLIELFDVFDTERMAAVNNLDIKPATFWSLGRSTEASPWYPDPQELLAPSGY